MGCLSCHSSVFCARPEHPLPTDFYFVPILSTWSQPTQLCNQPLWAKWLTPIPRAARGTNTPYEWQPSDASHAMCCQISALPFRSITLQWATKRFEWLYDAKGRRVPPSLYVAENQEHIVSSAGICSQNSTHLFFFMSAWMADCCAGSGAIIAVCLFSY